MKINDGFILRKIFGEYLLFPVHANEAGDELVSLNEVGALIWELAAQGLSESDIMARIVEIYHLERGSVEEESVHMFISVLCDWKLLYREEKNT
ncbi:MAG: PqqD family protein [Faecousia sp.]